MVGAERVDRDEDDIGGRRWGLRRLSRGGGENSEKEKYAPGRRSAARNGSHLFIVAAGLEASKPAEGRNPRRTAERIDISNI